MTRRIAIYARCSTEEQTTENQIRELRAVASRHGWDVVAMSTTTASAAACRARIAPP
jgi:DNA invertase Pin-like site-specific DNA recombinase